LKTHSFFDWHAPCIIDWADPVTGRTDQKGRLKMFATFTPARENLMSLALALLTALVFVSNATSALPIA
jgi:hypothetical protein